MDNITEATKVPISEFPYDVNWKKRLMILKKS